MGLAQWTELGLSVATVAAIFIAGMRGNLGNNTINLMQANKKAQDDAIKRLEDDAKGKADQISNLVGQVQILKDVPLAQIAKSLEVVAQTHLSIQQFLSNQEGQAKALADAVAQSAADKVINYLKDKQNG